MVDRPPRCASHRASHLLQRSLGACLVALALTLVVATPAMAGRAQDSPILTVGNSTTTAPGDAATVASKEDPVVAAGSGERFLTEDRKLFAIVGGLVVIAIALTLLTVRYWRQTKPVSAPEPVQPPPRHARTSPAAFPAAASDPPTEVAPAIDAEPDLFVPATTAVSAEPLAASSRRAVAGADHAAADAEWEPRGTGEHERVDVPTGGRGGRPGRDVRKAALGRTESTS